MSIEIRLDNVDMPSINEQRYRKICDHTKFSEPWHVLDTHTNTVVYKGKGKFENVTLACHNLNKNYYRELNKASV
jgi:hypothetical protein